MTDVVSIERLVLRVGERDDESARVLGREVAEALYERLRVAGITGDVHLARVELRIDEAMSAAAIAERIWEALR